MYYCLLTYILILHIILCKLDSCELNFKGLANVLFNKPPYMFFFVCLFVCFRSMDTFVEGLLTQWQIPDLIDSFKGENT